MSSSPLAAQDSLKRNQRRTGDSPSRTTNTMSNAHTHPPDVTLAVEIPAAGVTVVQPLGTSTTAEEAVRRSRGLTDSSEECKNEDPNDNKGAKPAVARNAAAGPTFDDILKWTAQDVANYVDKAFREPDAAKLFLAADVRALLSCCACVCVCGWHHAQFIP